MPGLGPVPDFRVNSRRRSANKERKTLTLPVVHEEIRCVIIEGMTLDKRDRGILLLALGVAIEQTRKAIAACSHPQFGGMRFNEVVERERTLEQFVELRQRLLEDLAPGQ